LPGAAASGETREYVSIITGRTADDWASDVRATATDAERHADALSRSGRGFRAAATAA
jgi:hypothetical protein